VTAAVLPCVHGQGRPDRHLAPVPVRSPVPTLPEALRRWRGHLDLTVRDASHRLGVAPTTVRGWELGVRPQPLFIPTLCRALGMAEDELRLVVGPDRVRTARTSGGRGASELCRARLGLGLSHTQVALKIGVTPATVSRWENGHRLPSPRLRSALAAPLRMTPAELDHLPEPAPGGRWDGHALPGLRALRAAAGLSQRACAEAMGVTGATVNRWENGAGRVPRRRAGALAAVLGVSLQVLLTDGGRPSTAPPRARSPLSDLRRARGMTQREAAALLGISVGSLSRYETGHRDVPVVVARAAAQVYRQPLGRVLLAAGVGLPTFPARPWTRSALPAVLRAARLHRGLTTAGAARLIRVSPQTISRWEGGTSELPVAACPRFEVVYGLPPGSLQPRRPRGGWC